MLEHKEKLFDKVSTCLSNYEDIFNKKFLPLNIGQLGTCLELDKS